jgi:hypothetical protein
MNPKPEKIDAAYALVGGGIAVIEEKLVYFDGQTPPSDSAIETKLSELTAEYDALAWKRSREAEYPSVADLVVALYDTDDKSAVEAKRASVKAKYPKPE